LKEIALPPIYSGVGICILSLSKNVKVAIYKTIILPVVLYVCETWSLTVREEHKLRVFENRTASVV
jgi:hypothetical protein